MTKVKDLIADCDDSLCAVELSKISVNKKARTMALKVADTVTLTERQLAALKHTFKRTYHLDDVLVDIAPGGVLSDAALRQKKAQEDIIKQFEAQRGATTVSEVITGRKIKGALLPLSEVTPEAGRVRTSGQIFDVEYLQRRDNSWIVTFDITDKKSSIAVKLFCDLAPRKNQDGSYGKPRDSASKEKVEKRLKKGVWVSVYGDVAYDKYSRDTVITAYDINELPPPPEKEDNAPEKRVELHLHTQMSAMDGVSSATDLIARAAKWGHKAVAVTDHGVVQAFPEAAKAAKKYGIKVLYGVEGYVVDDKAAIAFNQKPFPLKGSFVVFDLETTGLSAEKNFIIEIGAVKIVNGEVTDSFSTFVEPPVPIPQKITELTSITDAMVKGAPKEEKAVSDFMAFCEGSVLVAHNALFDTGFIRASLARRGQSFPYCFIDTVALSPEALPRAEKPQAQQSCQAFEGQAGPPSPRGRRRAGDGAYLQAYAKQAVRHGRNRRKRPKHLLWRQNRRAGRTVAPYYHFGEESDRAREPVPAYLRVAPRPLLPDCRAAEECHQQIPRGADCRLRL